MQRLGFSENALLLPLAVIIGILSAVAAMTFHEAIGMVRNRLFVSTFSPEQLYGPWLFMLVLIPAAGGLAVGLISRYLVRRTEGHGVVDVIETVLRSRGRISAIMSLEKIFSSALTIGSGGSAGAEGPIVQIGAGISSGVGQLLQIGRAHFPTLIGCGTAAGISAIFGSPIGGVLFTLEVILLDFSIRAFTPIVLASVISYVTTQKIHHWLHDVTLEPIFRVPPHLLPDTLTWSGVVPVVMLGVSCGLIGAIFTLSMHRSEELFRKVPIHPALRPAAGGAALGLLGVFYVVVFGWMMLGKPKPFNSNAYPLPAFFSDGYGVIQQMLSDDFHTSASFHQLVLLLSFVVLAKIVGTCLTLSTGGSGGVIAPSLVLGATTGALLGVLLRHAGWISDDLKPGFFALIGMGAVLASVVHAPLASILILMEVAGGQSGQRDVILPAMLACVTATGTARLISRDSIYTLGLRRRGVVLGSGGDVTLLRRLTVDVVPMDPVRAVAINAPLKDLLDAVADNEQDFVALDAHGMYAGIALAQDVRTAIMQNQATPHLLVEDLARSDIPAVNTTDDLSVAFEAFSRHDVNRLPVCLVNQPGRVIGLISRTEVMRVYHKALTEN
ncbi:chloride channel protein [Humisphaera borealis]|uniref:Chloride channel protein n=1 Tax=Humisphaera borealis TaxID=2807512 RepID=A0A7M2X1I0_9BACT|nr:chloride channel protein [Humisphaera borealis]QOV91607.1 chloride channel protein [Humisphaera borealis]